MLNSLKLPGDLKSLGSSSLEALCDQIRELLIDVMSKKGGHIGPNLGIVELTTALHYVFDLPHDKLVWDVSHQSLTHKILSGRLEGVKNFHIPNGTSPFTNEYESEYDIFNVGHTSTSVSLACGLAKARDLVDAKTNIDQKFYNVLAVIGDGSLSGGQALEGLNIAGDLDSQLLIIVNDNNMSIDPNHGGLYKNLQKLRQTKGEHSNNLFKSFGLDYYYCDDGNDVNKLIEFFESHKNVSKPTVLHIRTIKGKGLKWAQTQPELWHYHAPFNKDTGDLTTGGVDKKRALIVSSTDVSLDFLCNEIRNNRAVVINAGSPMLGCKIQTEYPDYYLDVGIAEQSAVSFASAFAKATHIINKSQNVLKPYIVIPSTFLQRAFDQILQDWLLNNTNATLLVLGGALAETDYTHLGVYDIPLLSNIPNLAYLTPTSDLEYQQMLEWCGEQNFPTAIRTSGGVAEFNKHRQTPKLEVEFLNNQSNIIHQNLVTTSSSGQIISLEDSFKVKSELYQKGQKLAIYGLGHFFELGCKVAKKYEEITNVMPTVINPRFISHIDFDLLRNICQTHETILTLEDGVCEGGFGSKIAQFVSEHYQNVKVIVRGVKRDFVDQITIDSLNKRYRLDVKSLIDDINKDEA